MHLSNLLTFSYWFNQPFMARGAAFYLLVIVFLVLTLFGLLSKIIRIYRDKNWQKEWLRRSGNFGLTMGLLGLLWFFFRQTDVFFLAWRFWLLLWLTGSFFWVYRLVWYLIVRVPKIKIESQSRAVQEKYLP